jgi:hypothetical protein
LPQQKSRDAVDYDTTDSVMRDITPTSPVKITSPNVATASRDEDEPMYQQDTFEFSDVEPEPEPIRKRTRSQSRAKENSIPPAPLPPAEPLHKEKKIRRNAKKVDGEAQKIRRRRVIREEPAEINTDDEDVF